jgi:hypothetical protein
MGVCKFPSFSHKPVAKFQPQFKQNNIMNLPAVSHKPKYNQIQSGIWASFACRLLADLFTDSGGKQRKKTGNCNQNRATY